MINYSKYMNFEEFKKQLLDTKFFCKTDKITDGKYTFEKYETDAVIRKSLFYKTAYKIFVSDNMPIQNCNIEKIYRGFENTEKFNKNFLNSIIKNVLSDKNINKDKFITSFQEVFKIILTYKISNILDMYSREDILSAERYITSEHKPKYFKYEFIWDNIGYSFGKIQINLNKDSLSKHEDFLKSIGFKDNELEDLTINFIKGYTNSQLREDKKLKSALYEKASKYNYRLNNNGIKIDEYSMEDLYTRLKNIVKYKCMEDLKLENDIILVLISDYDNQFYFSPNGTFAKYINQNKKNKDFILTVNNFLDFKLSLKYGKLNPIDIKRRSNNIVSNIKPTKTNISVQEAFKLISKEELFNAVSMNEISFKSYGIDIHNITSEYDNVVGGAITKNDIKVNDVNLKNKSKEDKDPENITKRINELLDIPDISNDNSVFNKYDINRMVLILLNLMKKFNSKHIDSNRYLRICFEEDYKEFTSLCKKTNNLTSSLEETHKQLISMSNRMKENRKTYKEDTLEYADYSVICSYTSSLEKAYSGMLKSDFAKANLLLTGVIDETNSFLFKDENTMREFADSFLAEKPKKNITTKKPNAISYFFKNSKFLYMKELDYRHLEAFLRQGLTKPSEIDTRKVWILVYIVLVLIAKKNVISDERYLTNRDNFIDNISILINRMRNQKWNYEYSDTLKDFSNMYSFVKYKSNPFTSFMRDKGFNESQANSKELREIVEHESKKVIDSIKEFTYGENKIYDIFQAMADIAYELSTPMTLYTNFNFMGAGESIVNEFMNACVSSLEMQTSMLIFDFLFNFKIKIGKEEYSLNDLNNMLKMFNIIIEATKSDGLMKDLTGRKEIAKNTSEYNLYKQLGFFTYNKKWNKHTDITEEDLKTFTGFYLSDENFTYDIVEYCRNKGARCDAGDIKTITNRFVNLDYYEWVAIFACYKIINSKDNIYSLFSYAKFLGLLDVGYMQIREFYNTFKAEADNKNPNITYINPQLSIIVDEIISDRNSLDKFINNQKDIFFKFQVNIKKNEEKVTEMISRKMSDNKIYDWMMKMLPTYQMIAEAFGFADLNGIKTLEDFVGGLINSLNIIVKITFDKWKRETVETVNVRRIQFIQKERYYYIQSFPVLIDWIVKNLEFYLTSFNTVVNPDVGIDSQVYADNMKNLESITKSFIIMLKENISTMSAVQIEEFKKELEESIITIENINIEQAKQLVKALTDFSSIKEYIEPKQIEDLSFMNEEQIKQFLTNVSNIIPDLQLKF